MDRCEGALYTTPAAVSTYTTVSTPAAVASCATTVTAIVEEQGRVATGMRTAYA
jgi:hypothetical protein